MKALITTMMTARPGKRVSASTAPSGSAITAASTVAATLTISESPTMP